MLGTGLMNKVDGLIGETQTTIGNAKQFTENVAAIDIQGTNSITTEETCIQKMENTTPAVTFTSTSDVVGSLTLKGAAGVNNVGEYNEGSFTISDKLALVLKKDGYIYSNTYWFTDGSTKEAILSPSYGVTVGGMQICQDNASDVIGEGIGNGEQGGMVKFTPAVDGTPATLIAMFFVLFKLFFLSTI